MNNSFKAVVTFDVLIPSNAVPMFAYDGTVVGFQLSNGQELKLIAGFELDEKPTTLEQVAELGVEVTEYFNTDFVEWEFAE